MGATPDTSVTVDAANSNGYCSFCIAIVVRGADTTDFDDSVEGLASLVATVTNSALVDTPSATPQTAGALVFSLGINSSAKPSTAVTGAPTGFTLLAADQRDGGSTIAGNAQLAVKTDWTSGAVDPGPFSGATDSTNDSFIGYTIVVKPA